jgi:MFS family permease
MCALLSFVGSRLCDLLGRRMLLLPTLIGVGVSWMCVAVATAMVEKDITNTAAGKAGIGLYFIFSFIYCVGITPLQGVYAVEVFSYEQRAKGVGFSNFVVNMVSLINQFGTPVALANIGYKTYIIFSAWNFFECFVSYFFSVECKGFSLEELDAIFEAPNPRKASTQKRRVILDGDSHLLEVQKDVPSEADPVA